VNDLLTFVMIAGPIALLAGFVWLANQPDAPLFVTLSRQPLIGSPISRLRDHYRAAEPRSQPALWSGSEATDRGGAPAPDADQQLEVIFVGGGAILRSEPRSDADEVGRTTRIESLLLYERRAPWARVEWPPRRGIEVQEPGETEEMAQTAWVDLEARRRQIPPLGNEPSRPGPLPGRAVDPELLDLARRLMTGEVVTGRIGPYPVLHDLENEALFLRFDRSVSRLEGVYYQRFSVVPGDRARETIVLFRRKADYDEFAAARLELAGVESLGHASGGLVALHAEGSDPRLTEMTLLHELTHQLNRRALGPVLPPWLEEGLCEELSEGGWAIDHGLDFDRWVRTFRLDFGNRYRLTGPFASLDAVAGAALDGQLLTTLDLVALDFRGFVAQEGALNYAVSGWMMRYLLDGEERSYRERFRGYLASVAEGEPPSGGRLIRELGVDWGELDSGFRSYVLARARAIGAPSVAP
jgi:hypothetical protein